MNSCATWLLRSKSNVRQALDATLRASSSKNFALVYALSSNAPDMDGILDLLRETTSETIGCITSPLPWHANQPYFSNKRFFSCALAVIDRDTCVPFALENIGKEPAQVGRWHSARKTPIENDSSSRLLVGDIENWDEMWKIMDETWKQRASLPPEIENLNHANAFLYFTDNTSINIAETLSESYPSSSILGLIAAPTPFINGRPFSLIRNGKTQSSGAVGLALRLKQRKSHLEFTDLKSISPVMKVIDSKWDIIFKLDDGRLPADIIPEALRSEITRDKDKKTLEFYVGVLHHAGSGESPVHITVACGVNPRLKTLHQLSRMYRIIAGGSTPGSIVVEDDLAPPEGSVVQFFCRRSLPVHLPEYVRFTEVSKAGSGLQNAAAGTKLGSMVFNTIVTESEERPLEATSVETDCAHYSPGKFVFASEHGLVLFPGKLPEGRDSPRPKPWRSTVPGSLGTFCF